MTTAVSCETAVSAMATRAPLRNPSDVRASRKTFGSKFIDGPSAGRYWMTSRLAGSRLYFVASAARVPSSFSALSAAVSAVPTSVLPLPK